MMPSDADLKLYEKLHLINKHFINGICFVCCLFLVYFFLVFVWFGLFLCGFLQFNHNIVT